MHSWTRWLGIGAAASIIFALVPLVNGRNKPQQLLQGPLSKVERRVTGEHDPMPKLTGLDLTQLKVLPRRVTAPLADGKVAELTVDPDLQRSARALMQRYGIPESGIVVLEAATGKTLAYASYVNKGEQFDVNARAEAPAASVFKTVTGAALIETAGLNADTQQCYNGGRSRITADELRDDPKRDKWCASLGMAMGQSINVVFARLAQKHLTPSTLMAMGGSLGFGASVPFAVDNEPTKIEIPTEPLEFARASAGFWHSTLSPLAAAVLAQTIANDGVALQPRIVSSVLSGKDRVWEDDGQAVVLRRAIKSSTAKELTKMMLQTVANGSAFKSFHDKSGKAYIPGVQIAGKTGTLTRDKENRFYTWFIGFAPAQKPEVAIAALVVNTPTWKVRAPALARDVLRVYFADKGVPGVTRP